MPADWPDDQALTAECDAWRQELEAGGILVLGNALGGPETARTMRPDHGEMRLTDGPFLDTTEFIASVDVVSCADRQQAIELAAAHPSARLSRDRGPSVLQRVTLLVAGSPRLQRRKRETGV